MHAFSILAAESSGGSSLGLLLPIAAIGAVMYFLMIRPQRKRMKEQQAMQKAIGVGDEVITSSGIYGFITGEDGDKFWLEIDDDVQIRIARAAIQHRVTPEGEAKSDGDKSSKSDTKPDDAADDDADAADES